MESQPINTSSNFMTYLKSDRAIWYWITLIVTLLTAFAIFLIQDNFYPWLLARNVLGILFVVYLPGYTFVRILFPNKFKIKESKENLQQIERIALSVGASLCIAPLSGLFLYYTPMGLNFATIILALVVITVTFASVALFREYQEISEEL